MLYEAYRIYVDEISTDSGYPIWVTRHLGLAANWSVEETMDYALAQLEDWDKKNAGEKRKPGVGRFAVLMGEDSARVEYGGLTRQQFSEAAIQEEQDREDGIDVDRKKPPGGYDPSEYGDGLTDLP